MTLRYPLFLLLLFVCASTRALGEDALPAVYLTGTFGYDYAQGTIAVKEYPDAEAETFHMKAKWRGGITNNADKHKRNYSVKLLDGEGAKLETSFLGMRNDNHWILEACQVDMIRVRNRVMTDLWNDFAHKPYYFGQEPKALSGTRGQFVELYLNGQYRGIYCLTECVDRKQMKLKKYATDAAGNVTHHGFLYKGKDWSYEMFMGHNKDVRSYSTPNRQATSIASYGYREEWCNYAVEYPDIDDVKPVFWQPLYDAVNLICAGSDAEVEAKFEEYFDYPVFLDFCILLEVMLSTDNHGKNLYYGIYDIQESPRITFGVWDMDAVMGQRWSDAYYHNALMRPEQDYRTYITNNEHGDWNIYRRVSELNVKGFNDTIRYRYRDLRQTWLHTDSLIARFSRYIDRFETTGAAAREEKKWSYDTDIARLKLDLKAELSWLSDWIERRMNYLDTYRFRIADLPEVNSIEAVEMVSADEEQPCYNLEGHRVDPKTYRGLMIHGGKKMVIAR